jgi:predicted RNase H-like HicB family nuclease
MADRRDTMFNILLTPDAGGGLVVTCPELPEVVRQGDTRPEALENAADALAEAVALPESIGFQLQSYYRLTGESRYPSIGSLHGG